MSGSSTLLALALGFAARQHGVVSRQQLLKNGGHPRTISRFVLANKCFPVFPGVYLVGRPQLTRDGLLMASLLSSGDGSVLAARTSASLWGFLKHQNPIEVLRTQKGRRSRALIRVEGQRWWPELVVHRCHDLPVDDVTVRRGFRLTSPERTLLDCAARLPEKDFGWAFMEADRLELLDDRSLQACAGRSRGRKGGGVFKSMVFRRIPNISEARSILEAIVLELVQSGLIPQPEINRRTHKYRPDFRWSAPGVLVEADGYEFHRGREAFENDTSRQNDLRAEGWTVLRFTWRMVTERPEEVASTIRRTIFEEGRKKHR